MIIAFLLSACPKLPRRLARQLRVGHGICKSAPRLTAKAGVRRGMHPVDPLLPSLSAIACFLNPKGILHVLPLSNA